MDEVIDVDVLACDADHVQADVSVARNATTLRGKQR
jgi:hypothetical protein